MNYYFKKAAIILLYHIIMIMSIQGPYKNSKTIVSLLYDILNFFSLHKCILFLACTKKN